MYAQNTLVLVLFMVIKLSVSFRNEFSTFEFSGFDKKFSN